MALHEWCTDVAASASEGSSVVVETVFRVVGVVILTVGGVTVVLATVATVGLHTRSV